MFDFNTSLNDVAPVSPILLSVCSMKTEKSDLMIDTFCVLFLLSSRLKQSFESVVFDFNASPNDVAPLSSILLPVDLMKVKRADCS